MGAILPDDVGGRDAVHVAVVAVTVGGGPAWAGRDVGVELTASGYIANGNIKPHVGILDPFVKDTIQGGQRCWLYLYPRSITSLAHAWSHPAFPETDTLPTPGGQTERSQAWLREFCARSDCPPYEEMLRILERAANGETSGSFRDESDDSDAGYYRIDANSFYIGGVDASGKIPDEFWIHAEKITGRPISLKKKPEYFSCSC